MGRDFKKEDKVPRRAHRRNLRSRRAPRLGGVNEGFIAAMEAAGMSQKELAERSGLKSSDLSIIRHGQFHKPTRTPLVSQLYKIAAVVNVSVEELVPLEDRDTVFPAEALSRRIVEADSRMTLPDPSESVMNSELVWRLLSDMPERPRVQVSLCYGLTNERKPRSFRDIARILGGSEDIIRKAVRRTLDNVSVYTTAGDDNRRCVWCGLGELYRHDLCHQQKQRIAFRLMRLGIEIRPPLSMLPIPLAKPGRPRSRKTRTIIRQLLFDFMNIKR